MKRYKREINGVVYEITRAATPGIPADEYEYLNVIHVAERRCVATANIHHKLGFIEADVFLERNVDLSCRTYGGQSHESMLVNTLVWLHQLGDASANRS